MTNRQELWLEIAEAFGTPRDERTKRQRDVADDGLCEALRQLDIPSDQVYLLGPRYSYSGYWYPRFKGESLSRACTDYAYLHHDAERSTFACLMAALSDEDYKELTQ